MKMTRFRIENYKKIEDSGWISCGDLTAFVGKNEAGKSALFRGLSKLNPSDDEKYNGLKEFPRKRYTSEFDDYDWDVASVEFELDKDEQKSLKKIDSRLSDTTKVICKRSYSWDLEIAFESGPEHDYISKSDFLDMLEELQSQVQELIAPDGKGDQLQQVKNAIIDIITQTTESVSELDSEETVEQDYIDELVNSFSNNMNESWQKRLLNPILKTKLHPLKERIKRSEKFFAAEEWIKEHMPIFVYFDRYDVIEGAIHIPNFSQRLQQDPSAPHIRASKCLFEHVGLDINEIIRLDPTSSDDTEEILRKMADERAIMMSSASTAMTDKFSTWWEQRKHRFRYQIDGPFFRVWVSDDLDPSEIELDQRSMGLQYFFSFYIVFLVESEKTHKNSILLLDEPGLHMHGTAQTKIVKFLGSLSKKNQTLYTTHSPFLIDGDKLERIRVVHESKDGTTKVSEDVWPKDKDALFPLQAALGYSIAQTLFYGKRQLIVEGITDYQIFKSINQVLLEKNMPGLREDTILIPAGGVSNLIPLASMLVGHRVKIAAILDSDEPGHRKGQSLRDNLFKGKKTVCVFVGDHVVNNKNAELEDIFPEDFYLRAVKESYDGLEFSFNKGEKEIPNICKRISKYFERQEMDKFEKWRPVHVILEWIEKDSSCISGDTLETFSNIFQEANKLL